MKLGPICMMTYFALTGCSSLAALSQSGSSLPIYEVQAPTFTTRETPTRQTLLVVEPTASAAIGTDRILVRTEALAISYLPDAKWIDELPLLLQSVFIRALGRSGGLGFVGAQGAGPVPDVVLLSRIDAFHVTVNTDRITARVTFDLTILNDEEQRVLGTRIFAQEVQIPNDDAQTIVQAFQLALDDLLPAIVDWTVKMTGQNAVD